MVPWYHGILTLTTVVPNQGHGIVSKRFLVNSQNETSVLVRPTRSHARDGYLPGVY